MMATVPRMEENAKQLGVSGTVTLRDVAEALNISHSTVSRALQNASKISAARRQQVQDMARKMGYRPNAMATRLGHQRHAHKKAAICSEIAWINYWTDPKELRAFGEFNLYWKGASQRAEENGYRLEEFVCNAQLTPARLQEILLARNIHGILIPPHGGFQPPNGWDKIDWQKFCVVRFGHSAAVPRAHVVTSNHLTSAILAIENMNRLGYQRIGFVASRQQHFYFRAGFLLKQALQDDHQAPIFNFSLPATAKELTDFAAWLKKYKPEAILSDLPQTRGYLEELGYRVPEDIGLAATSVRDGNADAGIEQHSEEIGKAAVEILLSLLIHNQTGVPEIVREIVITGNWVNGGSLPPRERPALLKRR